MFDLREINDMFNEDASVNIIKLTKKLIRLEVETNTKWTVDIYLK